MSVITTLANPRSQVTCAFFGSYAFLGGLISFAGWVFDVPRLTDWYNNGISIQPNTTIAVMAAGAALIALAFQYRWLAAILGVLVAFIGGSVLFQYLSGINLGIDSLLMFDRTWGRVGVMSPGRMGPPGATSWTLIGVTLVLSSLSGTPQAPGRTYGARRLVPVLGLITASMSTLSIIGYLYGASVLYTVPTVTVIALQTATFILAVSLGLVTTIPEHGPMRLISEDTPAGILTRRILPGIIALPILVGFLQLSGERAGFYDSAFGSALSTVTEIGLFLVLIRWTGNAISQQTKRREEADEALRASQRRVTDTLESITDGFVTFDHDWHFTYVNAEAEKLLGKTRSELMGRTAWELFYASADGNAERSLRKAAAERVSMGFEVFNTDLKRWFSNRAYPTADGSVAVYFQDITDQKQAEEALRLSQLQLETELSDSRLLQQISAELIHEDDIQALYEKITDAAAAIMRSDFASMQLLEGEHGGGGHLSLIAFRGFTDRAAELWKKVDIDSNTCGVALNSGERTVIPDVKNCDFLAGSENLSIYLQTGIQAMQTTPLLSRGGKILGMISTHWSKPHQPSDRDLRLFDLLARQAADLVERRKLELQREALLRSEHKSRTTAEQANRLKDEFLATLSHELRNPLNVVLGYSELLLRTPEIAASQHLSQMSEALKRNAQSQSQLINDLIDLSRLQMGKVSLNTEAVSLGTVVDNAVETVRAEAAAKQIQISVSSLGELLVVDADPLRLQQVVWNLLNNAVKFTPSGGDINISLHSENKDVLLTIEDSGPGIDPEFLPHVFEMFRQADSSSVRRHGGMGIGLALVQQLVQLHGGTVAVDSNGSGRGAKFTIRLPARHEKHLVSPIGTKAPMIELSGLRILVIDDSKDTTEMLRRLLEVNGAKVQTAGSGAEGLEMISRDQFDVVISDISMPEMDGFEFLRQMKAQPQHQDVPVLALTGFGRPEDIERAKAAGFFSHITKPFDLETLATTLQSVPTKSRRGAS